MPINKKVGRFFTLIELKSNFAYSLCFFLIAKVRLAKILLCILNIESFKNLWQEIQK